MESLPTSVYIGVGVLILSNVASVISFFVFIFKGGMFVAETRAGIKDAKDCAVRAHTRIDAIAGAAK